MPTFTRSSDARDMEIIDEYIEHLRRERRSDYTKTSRRGILEHLNRDLPHGLGEVSDTDLADWLFRDDWTQNTQATYYRCLKSFYTWASDPADRWLNANPMEGVARVRTAEGVAHPCSDEQLKEIITRAKEPFLTWAKLAAYQGMRCVEISRANREDFTEQLTTIPRGKGNRRRVHDTDPTVWEAVRKLPPGPIARRRDDGTRASPQYVGIHSRSYFHRVLHVEASMHDLRHWLGCTMQARYRDARVTQKSLGHAQLASTQIYTDATDEQQRAARATLPRFA